MNESEIVALLRRADLPRETFDEIVASREGRKLYAVRLALAAHPRTPRTEALSLVGTLYWRGLARLSADARVHPQVRRSADVELLRRLPQLALAEKVDLARTAGRGVLPALRLDPEPRVTAGLLDNRFTTEPDVVQAAARRRAPPAVLATIAEHRLWGSRPSVRAALLGNPALPPGTALVLLARGNAREAALLRDTPGVSPLLRALAERFLAPEAATDLPWTDTALEIEKKDDNSE